MSLQELEISERIHIMEAYYDLNALLEDRIDNQSIATYYKRSDFFYNLVHSRGGHSIHMGLSDDGFYKKSDFTQQAKFVAEYITDSSKKVLEIGAGKLFNTKFLAKSFPDNQFTAMDLPNRNFLKSRVPKNVSLMEGDFNDLSEVLVILDVKSDSFKDENTGEAETSDITAAETALENTGKSSVQETTTDSFPEADIPVETDGTTQAIDPSWSGMEGLTPLNQILNGTAQDTTVSASSEATGNSLAGSAEEG